MRRRSVLLLIVLPACLWRSYGDILAVHLTVLTRMADKLAVLSDNGNAPTVGDMAEFNYPAQRGREFLRQFSRYADRDSYRGFTQFLDRYEALLKQVDAARLSDESWHAERSRLHEQHQTLAQMAATIRGQLNG